MHREGVKGVFSPFFCIKRLMELHMSCKIENKMQDEREKRSWLSCVQNEKSDRKAAYFFPFGLPLAYWHHDASVQVSHAGLRALHTRLPWKMIQ